MIIVSHSLLHFWLSIKSDGGEMDICASVHFYPPSTGPQAPLAGPQAALTDPLAPLTGSQTPLGGPQTPPAGHARCV